MHTELGTKEKKIISAAFGQKPQNWLASEASSIPKVPQAQGVSVEPELGQIEDPKSSSSIALKKYMKSGPLVQPAAGRRKVHHRSDYNFPAHRLRPSLTYSFRSSISKIYAQTVQDDAAEQ